MTVAYLFLMGIVLFLMHPPPDLRNGNHFSVG